MNYVVCSAYAFESGSPDVLRTLRKGIVLAEASRALRALSAVGIATYVYVMLGVPGERRHDAVQTLRFLEAHADSIDFLNTSLLNLPWQCVTDPAPRSNDGSGSGPRLDAWQLPGELDLSLYAGFRPSASWERRDARRFLERELARSPAVSAMLRRTPRVFGPSHAALMALCGGHRGALEPPGELPP